MTDYKALVNALYEFCGSWRGVAMSCGEDKDQRGYYWNVAHGSKPSRKAKRAIIDAARRLVSSSIHLTGSPQLLQRKNVSVSLSTYNRLKTLKNATGATWEDTIKMLLEGMGR